MGSISYNGFSYGGSGAGRYIGPFYSVSYSTGTDDYGYDYIDDYDADYMGASAYLFSFDVSKGSGEDLQSVTFKANFSIDSLEPSLYSGSGGHSPTVRCYAYTGYVTPSESPPSGYISSDSKSVYISRSGATATFTLNTPGVTDELYILMIMTDVQPVAYYQGYGVYSIDDATYNDISGNFQAQQLSFTIGEDSVYTGSSISFAIANASGLALTMTLKYGNTTLQTVNIAAASGNPRSYSLTANKAWFDTAGVTQLTSMTVTVGLTDGTRTASTRSFTLRAGSDMNPSLGSPEASLVQTGRAATYFPSTWIAGYSKAKVAVSVTLPTNATVSSVKLSYPSGSTVTMSYNSSTGKYEGTTAAALTANTTLTVTVTDIRGLSASSTVTVSNVTPYSNPYISLQSLFRCDAGGVAADGGAYYSIKLIANYYTNLSGNDITLLTAKIKNGTANSISSNVTSILSGLTNPDSAYTIVVSIQDKVSGVITREFPLAGAHHDFQLLYSGGYTHLGIGMAPASTLNGSALSCDTIQLPSGAKIIIGGSVKLS